MAETLEVPQMQERKYSRPFSPVCCVFYQIWVSSAHSASGYYTIYGEESLQADHFNTRLSFGEPHTLWARTGYLGFIKRTELLDASGGEGTLNKVDIITVPFCPFLDIFF